MDSAGYQLRQSRLRSGLTYRDVARASEGLAAAKNNPHYSVPISRLSEIENHGAQPTIYRIYSLCVIYRLSFTLVLGWYHVDLSALPTDQEDYQPKSVLSLTQLLEGGDAQAPTREPAKKPSALSRASERPSLQLTDLIGSSANIPPWLLLRFNLLDYRYGFMGLEDATMSPLIPPGSILQIDMNRRQVEDGEWRNEHERPVYFIEHRDGYSCAWCSLHAKTLILQPHPMSPCSPRLFHFPQDAEVIGQVVGVARSLIPLSKSPRPTIAGPR